MVLLRIFHLYSQCDSEFGSHLLPVYTNNIGWKVAWFKNLKFRYLRRDKFTAGALQVSWSAYTVRKSEMKWKQEIHKVTILSLNTWILIVQKKNDCVIIRFTSGFIDKTVCQGRAKLTRRIGRKVTELKEEVQIKVQKFHFWCVAIKKSFTMDFSVLHPLPSQLLKPPYLTFS